MRQDVDRGMPVPDFSQRRLIAADLIMSDQFELWYELFAQSTSAMSEQVNLFLTWVSDLPLPPNMQFTLKFGDTEYRQHAQDGATVTWDLPVKVLIDPRNGRIRMPLVLTVEG